MMDDFGDSLEGMYPTYASFQVWRVSTATYGGFDSSLSDCANI